MILLILSEVSLMFFIASVRLSILRFTSSTNAEVLSISSRAPIQLPSFSFICFSILPRLSASSSTEALCTTVPCESVYETDATCSEPELT